MRHSNNEYFSFPRGYPGKPCGRPANFDSSLPRLQQATGIRLLEDLCCLDELLGEQECFVRGKAMSDSEMEFPHGVNTDFTEEDHQIFQRMQERVRWWTTQPDTARHPISEHPEWEFDDDL